MKDSHLARLTESFIKQFEYVFFEDFESTKNFIKDENESVLFGQKGFNQKSYNLGRLHDAYHALKSRLDYYAPGHQNNTQTDIQLTTESIGIATRFTSVFINGAKVSCLPGVKIDVHQDMPRVNLTLIPSSLVINEESEVSS